MTLTNSRSKGDADWRAIVAKYHRPNTRQAVWQLVNTFIPFVAVWYLAYRSLSISYWLTLALSAIAAGLLVRIFIIQHDCGHGAFVPSKVWNNRIGTICSVFTATPYLAWRHDHALHHANAGDLDHRGVGDIKTLTVEEYRSLSRLRRLHYRLYRHPLLLFVIGPVFHFLVAQRFTAGVPADAWRERRSVHLTNLALLLVAGAVCSAVGVKEFLLVQVPISAMASSAGVFLFYVQHQFDEAYWVRHPDWEYTEVALRGSSYYKLPKILQWFTGNIGLHHVHHLSPRIPNYLLQRCHDENPIFHTAPTMTFWEGVRTIVLSLWDEERQRLISFGEYRRVYGAAGA